jgi:predicted RNA-binding Zn-ribbon protein involved in translation (DUF1610 family)
MALAEDGVTPTAARGAVRQLIRESEELPTVALLLRTCRSVAFKESSREWKCPNCGSDKVAGIVSGPAVCFDCEWQGVL